MNIKLAVIFAVLTILFTAGIIFLVARDEQMSIKRPSYSARSPYRPLRPSQPAPQPVSEEEFEEARKSLPKTDKIDLDIK